jgi:hypothetical protein
MNGVQRKARDVPLRAVAAQEPGLRHESKNQRFQRMGGLNHRLKPTASGPLGPLIVQNGHLGAAAKPEALGDTLSGRLRPNPEVTPTAGRTE